MQCECEILESAKECKDGLNYFVFSGIISGLTIYFDFEFFIDKKDVTLFELNSKVPVTVQIKILLLGYLYLSNKETLQIINISLKSTTNFMLEKGKLIPNINID